MCFSNSFQWAFPDNSLNTRKLVFYSKMFGLAAGFLAGAIMSDHLGRRRTIFAGYFLMCAAQCATAVSGEPLPFSGCQTLLGVGAGTQFEAIIVHSSVYTIAGKENDEEKNERTKAGLTDKRSHKGTKGNSG